MSTTDRFGYNPNQAGAELLAACAAARKILKAHLVKPPVTDEAAFIAYLEALIRIRRMDHHELRAALKAL
jgi:hypothetical protein